MTGQRKILNLTITSQQMQESKIENFWFAMKIFNYFDLTILYLNNVEFFIIQRVMCFFNKKEMRRPSGRGRLK